MPVSPPFVDGEVLFAAQLTQLQVASDPVPVAGLSALTAGTGITLVPGVGTLTINGTVTGTVQSVAVATANGFAGSVATPSTTPIITLTTPLSGLLKGNGTAMSAATAGTDYSLGTSALGTGIVLSTTGTGALSIATAGDFPTLNQNTTGTAANVSGIVAADHGGTGVNNGAFTITTAGSLAFGGGLTTVGAFASTFTMTGVTAVTFPTSGTLAVLGANTFTGAQNLNGNNLTGLNKAVYNTQAATSGTTGAVTVDWTASGACLQAAPTGNITYTFTAPGVSNVHLQLLIAAATPSRTLTFPGTVKQFGSTLSATTNNKATLLNFWWDGTDYLMTSITQV